MAQLMLARIFWQLGSEQEVVTSTFSLLDAATVAFALLTTCINCTREEPLSLPSTQEST